jgi:undecaprenyl-diphosphatase
MPPSTSVPEPQPEIMSGMAPSRRGWVAPTAMIVVGAVVFAAIAGDVRYDGWLVRNERVVNAYFHQHSGPVGVMCFAGISGLGELKVIAGLGVGVGAVLVWMHRWRELAGWAIALTGSGLINGCLKDFFRVPRPMEHTFFAFSPSFGYSFPSGHAMAVTIATGTLAFIALRLWPMSWMRRAALAAGVVLVALLECFALVYMGVHYVSDVAGGLAVSLAWLGVIRLILPPLPPRPALAVPISSPAG